MGLKSSCTLTAVSIYTKWLLPYTIWSLNHILVQVWRDAPTPPGLPCEKEPRWDKLPSTLSKHILKASSNRGSITSLRKFSQWLIILPVKRVFLASSEASPGAICSHCPLSSPCGSLWRESLHPLCSHPLSKIMFSVFSVSSGSVFVCKIETKFGNHCLINGLISSYEPSRSLITSTPTSTFHVSTCSHSRIRSRLNQVD